MCCCTSAEVCPANRTRHRRYGHERVEASEYPALLHEDHGAGSQNRASRSRKGGQSRPSPLRDAVVFLNQNFHSAPRLITSISLSPVMPPTVGASTPL